MERLHQQDRVALLAPDEGGGAGKERPALSREQSGPDKALQLMSVEPTGLRQRFLIAELSVLMGGKLIDQGLQSTDP
ncbi:hypothetical protein B7P34_09855 [Streptosporangium nondiastaticum]|uniref:Uncharacterized protein n=1 Tax=Streptosporangium nondiastaticum TaxID=35764 RepID=A0A9X7JS29_9ACTN|nr:hypothetical protein B7P34_09855 [Streptosporangium nondiastaticum]